MNAHNMINSADTERREFKMDKRLLWDVITKQAGTIEKSILEAVMNSIDAGATKIEIEFTPTKFKISDNGKGFASEDEIKNFFETFGYPHEENDARYGKYRMGRGQLFCFGHNRWISQLYSMVVDLKPQEDAFKKSHSLGLGYHLTRLTKPHPGCSVEVTLYDPLLPRAYNAAILEIENFVKYAEVPVLLNGTQINIIPSDEKWSLETDDAYFNLKAGSNTIKVYNLGVFVRDHNAGAFGGIGGEIVSKQRLDVNFARNDIHSTCPIWRSIQKTLREQGGVERKRKTKLSDADRESMATEMLAGDMNWQDILEARVITDCLGAHKSIASLANNAIGSKIVAVPTGDRRGEKALTTKIAHVISTDTLDRFKVKTTSELCAKIRKALEAEGEKQHWGYEFPHLEGKHDRYMPAKLHNKLKHFEHLTSDDLSKYFNDSYETVPEKNLSKPEKIALAAIQDASWAMHRALCHSYYWKSDAYDQPTLQQTYGSSVRKILIGESDTAQAWTDGAETIWIERKTLNLIKQGEGGWIRLSGILLHEYTHSNDDRDSHLHDAEFFEKIEKALIDNDCIAAGMTSIRQALYTAARTAKKLGHSYLTIADKNETIARSGLSEADASFASNDLAS